ncbi:MAG: hypothetical protein WC975_09580 [Phycisphaerae bacterium]
MMGGVIVFFMLVMCGSVTQDHDQKNSVGRDEIGTVAGSMGKVDLAVIFTGSTRGEFGPCGCGGVYEGGLARRATFIDRVRAVNSARPGVWANRI